MGEFNGKKRSELPDSVFGIPQERKYPMPDEKHTRSAIKLFNHVDPKYEEQLAKAVIRNMKKYGIDGSVVGPNNRLRKYLPKNMIKESYIDESVSSAVSKDHKQKGYIKLSSLKKTHITEFIINKYKKEYPVLRHVRCKDTDEYIYDGYMWFKENELVCYVGSCQYTDDNTKWIVSLEILPEYRGYGLSNQILDFCIKNMKCRCLSVNKNNELAKKIYDKYGFKTYHEDKTMYYMTLDNISSSNESMISTTEKAKYDPPYTAEEVKRVYGTKVYKELIKDPAHKYRMDSGIELIHREPTKEELERIWKNWNLMSNDQKMKSDKKSIELFGKTNQDHYKELINSYVVNESYIEESSQIQYFNSPEELSKWMKSNIKYKNFTKLMSPEEVYKEKKGSCHDQVMFELYCIRKMKLSPKALFIIEYSNEGNGRDNVTHSLVYYNKDNKVYWFENAWGGQEGIHEFNSISELKNTIKNLHSKKKFGNIDKYPELEITSFKSHKPGETLQQVVDISLNEAANYTTQETGISTIIFDIGDVLIRDNFKKFLKSDPDIPNELVDTIKSLWFIAKDDVDDTMDLETYREIVNKRMGVEFSKYIPKLFQYGVDAVEVLNYTIPMIQDLKDKGYKVYYLSNWSAWTHDLLQKAGKFDFLKYMDGGVFSYDVGYRKPDSEIYQILLNRYKINPEEAVFFDDRKENIEAANKLGIHGVLFDKHDSAIVYNTLEQFHMSYQMEDVVDNSSTFAIHNYGSFIGQVYQKVQSTNNISKNHRYYGYDMEQDVVANYMNQDAGTSFQEYGTTGGTIVGTNQPDSVYIVNYMQNNVFSGHKEQKQAICKKGMNQMYTTKNGKSVPVDKNKFKEEASDVSVFKFKGSPFLSYDKIVESAIQDSDYYSLLTGDDISSPEYMKYDNRFIEEEPYTEYLDDITSCIESSIVGTQYSEEYPYMKILTESVDGRCWNYYNDINGYFVMNELTGLRSPSYDSMEEIPESQIKVIERGTIYLGE